MRTCHQLACVLCVAVIVGCGRPLPQEETADSLPHPCSTAPRDEAPILPALDLEAESVSPANLRVWVELLSDPGLKGRRVGSDESKKVASLLAHQFAALSLAAPFPGGDFCQPWPFLETHDQNVVGHLAQSTDGDERPALLIGAHYDGQGLHPGGPSYPGADDNASGIAALLEIARIARRRSSEWNVDLVFVAFGGEEAGLQGSRSYLSRPTVPIGRLRLMINLDMLGRPYPEGRSDAIGVLTFDRDRERVEDLIRQASSGASVHVRDLRELGSRSVVDADAFLFAAKVPTLHLSTGLHDDHHRPTDTPERIDYAQTERAVNLVLELLSLLSGAPSHAR